MWQPLWPDRERHDVPIGHVTNGVHVPTWIGTPMRELLDRHLPEGWCQHAADPEVWARVQRIPAAELWETRCRQRFELVEFIRARSVVDRLARDDLHEYVSLAAGVFDPDVLTVGFARRVATYKRLDLLIRDPEWTFALLAGDRPVQVVLAGKAHPRDEEAKRSLQRLFGLKGAKVIGERVVFLDDYDLYSASQLVRGCDVWLNVPRPPLEASGTSGMKSVFNGGLQLSVLDGWWAEAYRAHRAQRLGDRRRGRSRPPRAGRAPRGVATPAAGARGRAGVLRARRAGRAAAMAGDGLPLTADAGAALLGDADARRVRGRAVLGLSARLRAGAAAGRRTWRSGGSAVPPASAP